VKIAIVISAVKKTAKGFMTRGQLIDVPPARREDHSYAPAYIVHGPLRGEPSL